MNESTELAMDRIRAECTAAVLHSPGATVLTVDVDPHEDEDGALFAMLELTSGHLIGVGFIDDQPWTPERQMHLLIVAALNAAQGLSGEVLEPTA